MVPWTLLLRRSLSTEAKNNIGEIFTKEKIQKMLLDITRFDEGQIFGRRPVPRLRSPKLMFMTNEQLERAKSHAYDNVKARLQMPPVMAPDTSEPEIITRDEEIVGYTKFKIMFIDISPGYSNRQRLMSVREPDGTLRFPTHEEKSRLNHIFYPNKSVSIDPPKLFEEENMLKLLKSQEYVYILNRACVQFEPDDPRYVAAVTKVYEYIDSKGHHDKLRSTRHFGPMCLHLAYNKCIDGLILEMLSKKLIEDAAKLVKIYNTCHNVEIADDVEDLKILRHYADNHSTRQHNLDLALQDLENKQSAKDPTFEGELPDKSGS